MITACGFPTSGNCHKVRLVLEQLGRAYQWIEVDSSAGQTRTPEFLARNPNGRVPPIEREDVRILESYPAIRDWLRRVRATPRFVVMPPPSAAAAARIARQD
jgi:glutathione S-transferase